LGKGEEGLRKREERVGERRRKGWGKENKGLEKGE
jgi:hypothetical protein